MQMIGQPWGVSAFGAASVKALPDLVRVRFKISRTAPTPSAAFDAASTAIGAVRAALRRHGLADGDVQSSRLNLETTSRRAADGSQEFGGYQCVAGFAAESRNLDDVQSLLVDLVAAGADQLDGVDFDVITKPALRADARRRAVAAARAKAELYAETAGVRLGAIVHIEDVDSDRPGAERFRGHATYAAEGLAQDLAPGHVIVSAAVVLGFALLPD